MSNQYTIQFEGQYVTQNSSHTDARDVMGSVRALTWADDRQAKG